MTSFPFRYFPAVPLITSPVISIWRVYIPAPSPLPHFGPRILKSRTADSRRKDVQQCQPIETRQDDDI